MKLFRSRFDPFALIGVLFLVGSWLAPLPFTTRAMLPSPPQVVRYLADSFFYAPNFRYFGLADHSFLSALGYTVTNVLIAVVAGSALGMLLGLFSARLPALRAVTDPVALTIGNIPILLASPFLLMWFGSGRLSTVLVVAFYVCVTLYIYAQRAVLNLAPVYEASARTFGASTASIVRDVLLPGTLPEVLGGIRVALAGSWGLEAIAELLGDQRGMGKAIRSIGTAMDVEGLFAALLLLGLTAMVIDLVSAALITALSPWQDRGEASNE